MFTRKELHIWGSTAEVNALKLMLHMFNNSWKSVCITTASHQIFFLLLLQGKLSGYGIEEDLPTIVIVAYYDSFAVAPVSNNYYI